MQHEVVSFFARLFGMAWPQRPPPALSAFDSGVTALAGRRFDDALAHFTVALHEAATDAEHASVHNKRGLTHLQRGDRCAAVAAFVDALDADSRCVAVIVNVGNLLLEDGNLADAVVHYEAALRIDDGYAAAHSNLGIAYKLLGRRADAVREFRRASRIELRLAAPRPSKARR